jgi:hypothetical protein
LAASWDKDLNNIYSGFSHAYPLDNIPCRHRLGSDKEQISTQISSTKAKLELNLDQRAFCRYQQAQIELALLLDELLMKRQ